MLGREEKSESGVLNKSICEGKGTGRRTRRPYRKSGLLPLLVLAGDPDRSLPRHFHRSLSHRGNMGVGKTTSQVCLNKETRCLCCCHQVESNSFVTLWTTAHQAPCLWSILGKNTGVGCHFLLQGIFPGQEANPHLLFSRQILYHWATCVYHVNCKGTESKVNCLFLLLFLINVYLNNSYMNFRLCLK